MEIAAVAGGTVDHQLLAAVSREDPLVLAGRLRPTVDRHVLVAEETRYQFRHDLVREAVVADLLPGELLTLHARIAAALQEHPTLASGGAVAVDAELSHHWHAARDDQRAFDASIRAANQARHSGAHAEAMALDARALELWDAVDHRTAPSLVDVLQTAAETAQLAGRYRRAISLVRRALDETDDPLREANIRCLLALTLAMDARDRSAALAEADRAIETVAGVETSGNIARVLHTVARINLMYGNHSRAVSLGREALDAARAGGDDGTQLDARITVASATAISGPDFKAGIAELQHVLREAHERGAAEATDRAQNNLVVAVSELIDVDSDLVEQTIDQALRWLDEPEQRQDTVAHSWIRNNVAQLALTRGTRKKAEQALGGLQRRHLEGGNLAQFLAARADMRLMRGDLDGAHEDTMRILDLGLDSRGTTDWAFVIAARVAAERSDLEAVRDLVGRQRQLPARDRHEAADLSTPMRLLGVLVRAEVDAALTATAADRIDHLDRVDRAVTQMRTLLEESETRELIATPAQRHDARTLMQLAAAERSRAIAPGEGRWETIVDEALSPRDRVYARLRLAQMQLGAQDRERATKTLNEAHRQASRIGAELLRTQIEQLAASSAISLGSFSDA